MIALYLMGCIVAGLAQGVEYVRYLLRNDPVIGKASQCLFKGLTLSFIGGVMSGNQLRQQLSVLAQLENCSGGIGAEVALSQRSKLDELHIMNAQKSEIDTSKHPPNLATINRRSEQSA
jgi:hypothetical protein